ncbi:MAG: hypothetical protein WCT40_02385 [Candidatus Magasanikbacteria bacterium]|jgi:hypothetical protein
MTIKIPNEYQIGHIDNSDVLVNEYQHNDIGVVSVQSCMTSRDDDSDLLLEYILRFTCNKRLYFDGIPYGKWMNNWPDRKPVEIPWYRWLVTSKAKRFYSVLSKELKLDEIGEISNFNLSTWRIGLSLGQGNKYIKKYCSRLGVDPDVEPDIIGVCEMILSKKEQEKFLEMKNDVRFIPGVSLYNLPPALSDWTESEWIKLGKYLNIFDMIIWSVDGVGCFASKKLSSDEMLAELKKLVSNFGMEVKIQSN